MKIEILSTAMSDLIAGRRFYEKQSEGLGEYFFDSLLSDIVVDPFGKTKI